MSNLPGCQRVLSSWMCLGTVGGKAKFATWVAAKRDDGECKSPKGYIATLSLMTRRSQSDVTQPVSESLGQ